MNIRLIVLPSVKIRLQTKKLAVAYAKAGPHFFVVENKKLIPHVTLFRTKIYKRQLSSIYSAVTDALANHHPVRLELYRLYPHPDGWLVWEIRKKKELSNLRRELAKATKAFSTEASALKRDFRPHITLTKYKNSKIGKRVTKAISHPRSYWLADIVAVTLYNKYAQVHKVLKVFTLK